jgi:hypothetical protein
MQNTELLTEMKSADYRKFEILGDEYTALDEAELCHYDLIEMLSQDWLRAYRRLKRQSHRRIPWTLAELETILANTWDVTQAIAVSLVWVDLNPCEDVFREAARLAQVSTLAQLEDALTYEGDREPFIAVVLSIVHHEVLTVLKPDQYYSRIEIVIRGSQLYRRYGQVQTRSIRHQKS